MITIGLTIGFLGGVSPHTCYVFPCGSGTSNCIGNDIIEEGYEYWKDVERDDIN